MNTMAMGAVDRSFSAGGHTEMGREERGAEGEEGGGVMAIQTMTTMTTEATEEAHDAVVEEEEEEEEKVDGAADSVEEACILLTAWTGATALTTARDAIDTTLTMTTMGTEAGTVAGANTIATTTTGEAKMEAAVADTGPTIHALVEIGVDGATIRITTTIDAAGAMADEDDATTTTTTVDTGTADHGTVTIEIGAGEEVAGVGVLNGKRCRRW